MATRNEKLERARQLILQNPDVGRRQIASKLRAEYGSGLRDAVILGLQRDIVPARQVADSYQFAQPITRRYKPLRRSRYNKLVQMNFTAQEAKNFSKLPLTVLTFIKDAAKARKELINSLKTEARFEGWSKTRFNAEVKQLLDFTYKDSGWADVDGDINPHAMLRHFRREAIAKGEWDPKDSPWRKRRSTRWKMKSRWKGDTIGQKRRWRTLHKEDIATSKRTAKERARNR